MADFLTARVGAGLPGRAAQRVMAHRLAYGRHHGPVPDEDRKSTRLNSSHLVISYAVFCLKKKKSAGTDGPSPGESRSGSRAADQTPARMCGERASTRPVRHESELPRGTTRTAALAAVHRQ